MKKICQKEGAQNSCKTPALHGERVAAGKQKQEGFDLARDMEAPLECKKPKTFPGDPENLICSRWGEQRAEMAPGDLVILTISGHPEKDYILQWRSSS